MLLVPLSWISNSEGALLVSRLLPGAGGIEEGSLRGIDVNIPKSMSSRSEIPSSSTTIVRLWRFSTNRPAMIEAIIFPMLRVLLVVRQQYFRNILRT